VRDVFLTAAEIARGLLDEPGLEERWTDPSSLEGMAIGALSAHLARAVLVVDNYLDQPGEGSPVDPAGYFLALDGVRAPKADDPLAQGVRQRATQTARRGLVALRRDWDQARDRLAMRLPEKETGSLIQVFGSVMTIDDYLVTRLVELIVHSDDLAVALGAQTPVFSRAASDAVLGCLWEMARRRATPMEMIRAMTRVERDAAQALRVL
jgi:hypothetical protein